MDTSPLTCTDEEILTIAHQLVSAYALKKTIRYGTARDKNLHAESVAEHVFAITFLAHYFLEVEPIGPSLDAQKVKSILLFHDFGEIKHGDIVTYHKTNEDVEREQAAANEVFAALPPPLQKIGYDYWIEYEEQKTPESHFAYAIDKMEPLFELLDPVNEKSLKRLKITYEMNVSNKFKPVAQYPVMKRFVEVISNDLVRRDIFWKE